jgi:hypothetical protein
MFRLVTAQDPDQQEWENADGLFYKTRESYETLHESKHFHTE